MSQRLTAFILAAALLLPAIASATPYYTPPATTVEPLAKATTLSDGLYKVNDYANNVVVYVLKEKGQTVLQPVPMAANSQAVAPQAGQISDPRRAKIYQLLDQAGAESFRGNTIQARESYREARNLLGEYVQEEPKRKGQLEITVTDASSVKRFVR
ncbi:MAG: hypothetical protein K0R63_1137 [Rickettsiales bacterium]|jgi:hypothetical protein|nr:hypothetical protein [Rickettsiales bacterium]